MDGSNLIDTTLRGLVDRALVKYDVRDDVNGDIREIYAEVKAAGFDTTIFREICREMRQEPDARNARYQMLADYRRGVGAFIDTPLGAAMTPNVVDMPRPFAEQPVHEPKRRGRPRKIDQHLDNARRHLGFADEPRGNA